MSRLTRMAVLLACAVGVGCPASSEGGVIPWVYDAIFGPVGSMRRTNYAPYYSGNVGANYLPAAYSYGYGTNGCSSCQQSANYSSNYIGCGCSPCGSSCVSGCSGGGCASGNCTVNSAPNGSLSPIADPSNYSRGIESRLEAIEKQLNIVPPREHTGTRPRTYDDDWSSKSKSRSRVNDGIDDGSAVPARRGVGSGTGRGGTGDLIDENDYPPPKVRNPSGGGSSDGVDPFPKNSNPDGAAARSQESFKANTEAAEKENAEKEKAKGVGTDASKKDDKDLVIPEKKPVPTGEPVDEKGGPAALRLDSRITSRAVSPRERLSIVVGFQKPVAAKPKAPTAIWAGNPRSTDLAQQR